MHAHARIHHHIPAFHSAINQVATAVETGFNVVGSMPVIGAGSGLLRMVAGKVQAVTAAVLVIVGLIGEATTSSLVAKLRFRHIKRLGMEHLQHGLLNVIRGAVEFFAGTSLHGFGSLFMLIPNLGQDKIFSPAFKYHR